MHCVQVGNIEIGKGNPLILIAGPCVIESEKIILYTAEKVKAITEDLKIPFIFKSSYRKDNRSSSRTFQGPGLEKGLRILQKVKDTFHIPVLSDIHDLHDASACGEVLDIIQVPAFLSMQTSLLLAVAGTGRVINVKKGQFLAAGDLSHAIEKIQDAGNRNILLTERGTFFGYHNLIVDIRNLKVMRDLGYPRNF